MDNTKYTVKYRKDQHLLSEERHEIEVHSKDGSQSTGSQSTSVAPTIRSKMRSHVESLYNGKVCRYKADEGKKGLP